MQLLKGALLVFSNFHEIVWFIIEACLMDSVTCAVTLQVIMLFLAS